MRIIRQTVEKMREEIEGAKACAKIATHYKQDHPTISKAYYDMAVNKLDNHDRLHSEVVKLIEKSRSEKEPPKGMLEIWEYEHEVDMEEYSIAKNMIALYNK